MRLDDQRESDNLEDRRGEFSGGGGGGFGNIGLPIGGRFGIGTILIALVGGYLLGVNPLTLLGLVDEVQHSVPQHQSAPAHAAPGLDPSAPAGSRARHRSARGPTVTRRGSRNAL